MFEQERMDEMLRQSMARVPMPTLSAKFDNQLQRRIHPQRLSPGKRLVLALYTVVALVISVWLMRLESIDWLIVVMAVAAPLAVVCAVRYRQIVNHFHGW